MISKRIARAFLIYPPTGLYDRFDRCQAPIESETVLILRPPMDLAYMAAALEGEGVECRIADYPAEGKGWDDLEKDLKAFSPDMLIASTVVSTFEDDCRAFALAKRVDPNMLTVAKGVVSVDEGKTELTHHAALDIILRGEPEFTLAEIAGGGERSNILGITYHHDGAVIVNQDRPDLADLDGLPFPARHLLKNELYLMPDTRRKMGVILTSKGCPYGCIFCLVGKMYGKKVIFRSPASLVAELEECVNRFNIRDFWFRSDTFTLRKSWVIEVCRTIVDKRLSIRWATNSRVDTIDAERLEWMKKAGCFAIGFGIESGNQEILDHMKKGITLDQCRRAVKLCKEKGILTYLFFMIGLPWDSRETVRQTVAFARELDGDISNFSIAYPFPDSELYRISVLEGLVKEGQPLRGDYSAPAIPTLHLTREEVASLEKWANRRLLLRPFHVAKVLCKLESLPVMREYIRAGLRMLRYSARRQ
jgi:radical SAM superfamily enzyme YgiQ (UPF0313 family)